MNLQQLRTYRKSVMLRLQRFADMVLADVSTIGYSKRKVLKVIVHPNFQRKGRAFNYLKSIGVVRAINMKELQFRQIK